MAAEPPDEDSAYLTRQLITCIGNKRALLEPIRHAVETVVDRVGRPRLRALDAFAGSGVVSRLLKRYCRDLVANDIEDYSRVISQCFLANRSSFPHHEVEQAVMRLNAAVEDPGRLQGFIERLYAPANEDAITADDRVFYTKRNAHRLDVYRQLIGEEAESLRPYLLGPLLSEASVHANTAGVFKGFYKGQDGIGRYGGRGADALLRIRGEIRLEIPVLSKFECDVRVHQADANQVASHEGGIRPSLR